MTVPMTKAEVDATRPENLGGAGARLESQERWRATVDDREAKLETMTRLLQDYVEHVGIAEGVSFLHLPTRVLGEDRLAQIRAIDAAGQERRKREDG